MKGDHAGTTCCTTTYSEDGVAFKNDCVDHYLQEGMHITRMATVARRIDFLHSFEKKR